MQSTLYGEKKRHIQKRVFWVLCTKTLKKKDMERTLYGKTKHYQKKCLLSVFEIRTKNDKTHAKHSLWMNNNITTNVYFQCL